MIVQTTAMVPFMPYTNMFNSRLDDIVRDTLPRPLEPLEYDFDIETEYELQFRAALGLAATTDAHYAVIPNDAPLSSGKLVSPASWKLPRARNSDLDRMTLPDLKKAPTATNLKKPPPTSEKHYSTCPSFHYEDSSAFEDGRLVQRPRFKRSDSSISTMTHYPWESPSYHRRLEEQEANAASDESSADSFPSFYSVSTHPRPTSDGVYTAPKDPPAPQAEVFEVQIAPGITAPLRGAKETTKAVERDYIADLSCWGCQEEIFCISDCRWALCPGCRTISPQSQDPNAHGLGLGVTLQTLQSLRAECRRSR